MVACLKSVPVQYFRNEYKQMMKTVFNPAEFFAPTVEPSSEDAFITKYPRDILRSGNYSRLPLLTGVSAQEGLIYTTKTLTDPFAIHHFDEKFADWIPRFLYYDPTNGTVTSFLKSYYFPNGRVNLQDFQHYLNLTTLLSDGAFNYPTYEFAKEHSTHAPVHLYFNSHQGRFSVFDVLRHVPYGFPETSPRIPQSIVSSVRLILSLLKYRLSGQRPSALGSAHGDTAFLLFNLDGLPGISRHSVDYKVSKALIKSIVAFASQDYDADASNKLTYAGNLWPKAEFPGPPYYMDIGQPGNPISEPFVKRMNVWDKYLSRNKL